MAFGHGAGVPTLIRGVMTKIILVCAIIFLLFLIFLGTFSAIQESREEEIERLRQDETCHQMCHWSPNIVSEQNKCDCSKYEDTNLYTK